MIFHHCRQPQLQMMRARSPVMTILEGTLIPGERSLTLTNVSSVCRLGQLILRNCRKKVRRDDEAFDALNDNEPGRSGFRNKRSSEGVLAPANWKSTSKAPDNYGGRNGESQGPGQLAMTLDGLGNENKVKKVKLKVGGVTRTISTSNGTHESGSFAKSSRALDSLKPRQRLNFEGNLDGISSLDKRTGLQGIPWKDFSKGGFSFGKEDSSMGKMAGRNTSGKQGDASEPVRKSKRVPKKRLMDGEFNDDEDDELRYLEKLKTSKMCRASVQ